MEKVSYRNIKLGDVSPRLRPRCTLVYIWKKNKYKFAKNKMQQ